MRLLEINFLFIWDNTSWVRSWSKLKLGNPMQMVQDEEGSSRRGEKARILTGGSPEKFGRYFKQLLKIAQENNSEYVFVTVWNEWGESAYLEPDTQYRYAYLEALQQAILSIDGD